MDDIIEDVISFNIDIDDDDEEESYIYLSNIPFDQIHPKHSELAEHPEHGKNIHDNEDDIVMLIGNESENEIEPKIEREEKNEHHSHECIRKSRPSTPNTNPNQYPDDHKVDEDKITKVIDLPVLLLGYLAEKTNKHKEFIQYFFDNHNHYKMISLVIWFLRITNYWSLESVQHQFKSRWLAHGLGQNTIDDILPFAENLTNEGAMQFIIKTQWEPRELIKIMEKENKSPLYGYDCCSWCGSNRDDFKENIRYKSKWNDNVERKYNVKVSNTPLRICTQALIALIGAGVDVRKDMHKNNLISGAKLMGVTRNEYEFLVLGIYQQVAMLQFLTNYL